MRCKPHDDDPHSPVPYDLDCATYWAIIAKIRERVAEHRKTIQWTGPMTIKQDGKYMPCANRANKCRTRELVLNSQGEAEASGVKSPGPSDTESANSNLDLSRVGDSSWLNRFPQIFEHVDSATGEALSGDLGRIFI